MPLRLFVYEFITGGGLYRVPGAPTPDGSLLAEGAAMRHALIEDLERIPGIEVVTLRDTRCLRLSERQGDHLVCSAREHDQRVQEIASKVDATFLIAPEIDNQLLAMHDLVTRAHGKIIGADRDLISWASNKNQTIQRLHGWGIPVPWTIASDARSAIDASRFRPVIVKPVYGAGSEDVRVFESGAMAQRYVRGRPSRTPYRLESYCTGIPVSVSLLLGADTFCPLASCLQHLTDDGTFRYTGGRVLSDVDTMEGEEESSWSSIARRARRLAMRVGECLPAAADRSGYLGIDMVIGDAQGWVIEVNPRLTTSYAGLRAATHENLARRMLEMAQHVPATGEASQDRPIRFVRAPCDFFSDGSLLGSSRTCQAGSLKKPV